MKKRYWALVAALAVTMVLVVVTRWSLWSVLLWLLVIFAGILTFLLGESPQDKPR